MGQSTEIITRFEDTRHGPRMLMEKVGEGVAFAADIMVSERGSELLCLWPSKMTPEEFRRVVGKHVGEGVVWKEGRNTLWGKMEHGGEFSLETVPFGPDWARRATRLLELPDPKGEDVDSILKVIAQVASETVTEPDLLAPEPLHNSLKGFIEDHSA